MSDLISLLDKERKRPLVCSDSLKNLKTTIIENITSNECKFLNDYSDEIEKKKRKELQITPNRNVFIEHDSKTFSSQRIVTLKEHDEQQSLEQSNTDNIPNPPKRIVIPQTISYDKEQNQEKNDSQVISQSKKRIVIIDNTDSNEKESTIVSQSQLVSSVPLFDSLSFSSLLSSSSSSTHTSSHIINQEYLTRICQILTSCNTSNNESKSVSKSSDVSSITNHNKSHSTITTTTSINKSSISNRYPQFECVRTPTQESHSFIPPELLDCCESNQKQQSILNKNQSEYWDKFHTSALLRETMIKISKRLIKTESIPIVDTHCHFDLIFDRLYIKHNNLSQYFDDYRDLYPSGLSFELAIHVFWRPRHLIEDKWIKWYSKYLNDERVYGACGIHPHWSSSWKESSIDDIERCLQHPKIVAIGEIGLDFGPKNTCNLDQQCRVFAEQLQLAVKWSKPIVIHSRDAYEKTFDIMKQSYKSIYNLYEAKVLERDSRILPVSFSPTGPVANTPYGISPTNPCAFANGECPIGEETYLEPDHKIHLHCFVGTINDVYMFTSYFTEIKFGFTPIISRGNYLHTVLQQLDLTQILSETDSPYFVPEELSNLSRCAHPGMVYSVVETIAKIRQLSIDIVAHQLRANARQIYGV
ncbi:unnamed protein product [Adineta steineri]|uniref:Uncharacterized protein n=1 Tax=Adineta steineri TaxID=433720 RepID=A0A818LW49_9BILA|nr:unnamed protein product [Adineta steineri]CAF3580021.1 unnamed protein product [Adineta steineri]